MNPIKIIVQGIPTNLLYQNKPAPTEPDSLEDTRESYLKQKSEYLSKLFSKFGPAECGYLFRREAKIQDDFAHVTFGNSADALEAWSAGQRREVAVGDHVLRLTLVKNDEETTQILNDDCLIKIFTILEPSDRLSVEHVCKRWEKLALRSWSGQKSLRLDESLDLDVIEDYVIRCGEYVELVDFFISYKKDKSSHEIIAEHCPNVKTLKIHLNESAENDEKFPDEFCSALSTVKHLRELKLTNVFDGFCYDFVDYLPADMEKIFLTGPTGHLLPIPNVSLSLDLSRFRKLKGFAINQFVIYGESLSGLEHLENLNFVNLKQSFPHESIVEALQSLTQLQHLFLMCCHIQDDVLLNIARNNKQLEVLYLRLATSVTDRSLMIISRHLKLKRLYLISLMNVELNFMDPMPELEQLYCNDCHKVKDEQLIKIIETSPKLKSLNVTGCKITRKLFDAANRAIMARDNGITLKIRTDISYDIEEEQRSPLLVIETFHFVLDDDANHDANSDFDYGYD